MIFVCHSQCFDLALEINIHSGLLPLAADKSWLPLYRQRPIPNASRWVHFVSSPCCFCKDTLLLEDGTNVACIMHHLQYRKQGTVKRLSYANGVVILHSCIKLSHLWCKQGGCNYNDISSYSSLLSVCRPWASKILSYSSLTRPTTAQPMCN